MNVTKANQSRCLFLTIFFFLIGALLVLLGRKLLLIRSAHGRHYLSMVKLGSLISLALTIQPLLNRSSRLSKTSDCVAIKYESFWLACYPKLMQVIHVDGVKSTGLVMKYLLFMLNIKSVRNTTKNLQSNATCEKMPQALVAVLNMLLLYHLCKPAMKPPVLWIISLLLPCM